MEFKIANHSDVTTVSISGVLTFDDHERFKGVVKGIVDCGTDRVEIDLGGTKMIDSAGIGMLLLANDRATKAGKKLNLRAVNGHVAKVIELSKVDQIIPVVG